ncbi:MAG: cohesin domain-containing protein [Candidatus Gracilibacteria bacterium]|nr:cohesin domain-containing protein [Candidatus Gracilibacteria bacterium]
MSSKIYLSMLMLSISLSSCVGGSSGSLSLKTEQDTISVADNLLVQVVLDTGKNEVDSVDTIINFDPEMLELEQIDQGEIFEVYPLIVSDNDNGEAKVSAASTSDFFNGDGVYATLNFKALKSGKTTLTFNYEAGSTLDSDLMSQGQDVLGKVSDLTLEIK